MAKTDDIAELRRLGEDFGVDLTSAVDVRRTLLKRLLRDYKEEQGANRAWVLEDRILALAMEGFPDGS